MSNTRQELIEHLTPPPGIVMPPYPAARDRLYRYSLVAIALCAAAEGMALITGRVGWARGIEGAFALSVLWASATFLVWLKTWRHLVRALGVGGFLLWPFWAIGGWALSLAASAIMAAKETHCFHFHAGRVIPWYSLALGLAMLAQAPQIALGIGWVALAWLWGWLAWGRSQLPLFEVS
ncbi:MAG: hypothetical protein OWU84_02905 [Firmicutes bacterium]|nr:hypothetical protein [Bacillota bacterium]